MRRARSTRGNLGPNRPLSTHEKHRIHLSKSRILHRANPHQRTAHSTRAPAPRRLARLTHPQTSSAAKHLWATRAGTDLPTDTLHPAPRNLRTNKANVTHITSNLSRSGERLPHPPHQIVTSSPTATRTPSVTLPSSTTHEHPPRGRTVHSSGPVARPSRPGGAADAVGAHRSSPRDGMRRPSGFEPEPPRAEPKEFPGRLPRPCLIHDISAGRTTADASPPLAPTCPSQPFSFPLGPFTLFPFLVGLSLSISVFPSPGVPLGSPDSPCGAAATAGDNRCGATDSGPYGCRMPIPSAGQAPAPPGVRPSGAYGGRAPTVWVLSSGPGDQAGLSVADDDLSDGRSTKITTCHAPLSRMTVTVSRRSSPASASAARLAEPTSGPNS